MVSCCIVVGLSKLGFCDQLEIGKTNVEERQFNAKSGDFSWQNLLCMLSWLVIVRRSVGVQITAAAAAAAAVVVDNATYWDRTPLERNNSFSL